MELLSTLAHDLGEPMDADNWRRTLPVEGHVAMVGRRCMATDPVINKAAGRTKVCCAARRCDRGHNTALRARRWASATSVCGAVELEVVIDGAQVIPLKRLSTESSRTYARFWYTPALPNGEHTVTFTVKSLPEGVPFYVGQFLVAGKVL